MCINFIIDAFIIDVIIIDAFVIDAFIYVTALTHRLARRGQ